MVLQMHGVVKRFAEHVVLDGLDWEVGRGQVLGLLGLNGAAPISTSAPAHAGLRVETLDLDALFVAVTA